MSESVLTSARYGKDLVRVFRVVRGTEFHQVVEYNVTVLLEGDIDTRLVIGKVYREPYRLIGYAATRLQTTLSSSRLILVCTSIR
jgi:hypothetical protein